MGDRPDKPRPPQRRGSREDSHPVLRAVALVVCIAAFLGALAWRALGW